MKYARPEMELLKLKEVDIITVSVTSDDNGYSTGGNEGDNSSNLSGVGW